MAVLQNIRNRAGILILIFVGVALFLFIIDPSTFNGLFHKAETNIAEIDGEKVPYQEFENRLNEVKNFVMVAQQTNTIDAETEKQLREQVWQEIQNYYLIGKNFNELGIGISEAEMEDMLWGRNIHSIIRSNFTNPQTGQIDTMYVRQFFEQGDLEERGMILTSYLKSQIALDREMNKYYTLLSQGLYTPTALAKENYYGTNEKVDFAYIALRYKDIADEEVKVSESDLKAYYDEHTYLYESDENTREFEYVTFPIVPNAEDSAATLGQMKELRTRFANTEEDLDFAKLHSEEVFEKPYFAEADVPGGLGRVIFENKEPGYISEIFSQDTSYMMFKVVDFITIPDSVKASHILITPDTSRTYQEVYALLDSLKTEVENGADFARLAETWSMGPSAVKGGDLGWFPQGAMVPQFNDACFYGKEGDLPIVVTQFGVHLINIEKQGGGKEHAELAIVKKHIDASTDTYNKIYADASNFASTNNTAEKFDKAVVEERLVKKIASNIKENDQEVAGLKNSRSLIKWAFNTEKGSISDVEEMNSDNCFIVAKLTQIREEGPIDFEYVKDQVEPIVIRKKKAAMLEEKINQSISKYNDLKTMSGELGAKVDTAKNIAFNSFSVPKLGIEPKLIATATCGETNKILGPVEGNNAMFVLTVVNKTEAAEAENYDTEKMQLSSTMKNRVNYELMEALIKATEFKDKRSVFF